MIPEKEILKNEIKDNFVLTDGKIIGVSCGLYKIKTDNGIVFCPARGSIRHIGLTPLVGDNIILRIDSKEFENIQKSDMSEKSNPKSTKSATPSAVIHSISQRKNALIRPAMANLDCMFVSMASASPAPILSTVDKLIAIAEYNHIEPYIVIGKSELDAKKSTEIKQIYEMSGFKVFVLSCETNDGIDSLKDFIFTELCGKTAAFSGASGVGKSTLMNKLFPELTLETGSISRKIERGKHTTKSVELYELSKDSHKVYIADTPGFSMLDFKYFDFFSKEDLPYTFREFLPYIGKCKYTKCSHTKEQGCAILQAINEGKISKSRHDSFLEIYEILKDKKQWGK